MKYPNEEDVDNVKFESNRVMENEHEPTRLSPAVSIITPTFNSERYIRHAIDSVLRQSFRDWELLVVDDCSTDSTVDTVQSHYASDPRIKVYRQDSNQGAGPARTRALSLARGRYIAYLDADDSWSFSKLEVQTAAMRSNAWGFSCTSYDVVDADGRPLDKTIRMMPEVDYRGFLTNNLLQTVGIMVDTCIVDPKLLRMPPLRRRQDAATWLQVLKAGHKCYGIQESLAQYRRTPGSLSSNKVRAAQGVWYLYRQVERLPFWYSAFCFQRYARLAVSKRTYGNRIEHDGARAHGHP